MKHKPFLQACTLLLAVLVPVGIATAQGPSSSTGASPRAPMGTAFTYQGQLKQGVSPVNANCDLQFGLWDSASNLTGQIGTSLSKPNVQVSNGLFTVQLDFGASAFDGSARYLGIQVSCPSGSGLWAPLSPRQPLTPAPHALHATTATTANNLSGSLSGDVTGTQGATSVVALRGKGIASYAPWNGAVLQYNGTEWAPSSYVQTRVWGTCGVGSTIRAINSDGSVVCDNNKPVMAANAPIGLSVKYLTDTCSNYSSTDGVGTVSITVPGPGQILVEANTILGLYHESGVNDFVELAIGTSPTDCGTQPWGDNVWWEIPNAWPASGYTRQTFTVRKPFSVSSAGTYTYYLNGYMNQGYSPSTDAFWYARVIATFFPN